ncbi:MAG TPA: radical SAM family heme chaperone HemW [Clostridia bacterium]|jgi:oxygen-independent coproporphyrinogen-3 oxidase|nr:radical SAM family heme chaperone HemW [Clostridia bacterium]HHY06602.1 radical SAM family heme chaperone HemW [Clostridia bacterium]
MMKTVGIYVHLPFCEQKCYYCDFVSFAKCSEQEKETYLQALAQEAKIYQRFLVGITGKSLYLGGGTPTCLTAKQLGQLFTILSDFFKLPTGIEITVEANPGTLNREKLQVLRKVGCNRLSLGVQSFSVHDLQVLGRIHSPRDVYNTYQLARQVGFANISLDLMYGLPGQSLLGWRDNLKKAVELEPEHLALYQLNIEQGTPFAKLVQNGLLEEFSQDKAFLMYKETSDFLQVHGYRHYEISNFALPGKEAIHNSLYWLNEEYLGLGVGAAGYVQGIRYVNTADLDVYQALLRQGQLPQAVKEPIKQELAMAETMFLGLRLLKGVSKEKFLKKYGITIENKYGDVLEKLKRQGLLQETATHVALTKEGLPIANLVFQEFL